MTSPNERGSAFGTYPLVLDTLFRNDMGIVDDKDIPVSQEKRLLIVDINIAQQKRTLSDPATSSEINHNNGVVSHYTSVLQTNTSKNAYEYLASIMPKTKDLTSRIIERDNLLTQLTRIVNETFAKARFKTIIEGFKSGQSSAMLSGMVDKLEKEQKEIVKQIESFKRNSVFLNEQLWNHADQVLKNTKNIITDQSLGMVPVEPRAPGAGVSS